MPDAPARGKFSVTHPGAKEYAVVFVGALGAYLLYKWWKGKTAPAAAAGTDSSGNTVYYPSPTGLSASQLLAWISDHQSSPARKAAPAPAGTKPAAGRVPAAVTGLRAANVTADSATLIWKATPGATGYAVIRAKPNPQEVEKTSTSASATLGGLKPRTSYTYYVTAEPNAGPGHATVTFTTKAK